MKTDQTPDYNINPDLQRHDFSQMSERRTVSEYARTCFDVETHGLDVDSLWAFVHVFDGPGEAGWAARRQHEGPDVGCRHVPVVLLQWRTSLHFHRLSQVVFANATYRYPGEPTFTVRGPS